MFSRFMEGRDPTELSLKEKATVFAQGVLSGKIFELIKPANMSLWKELSRYFARADVKKRLNNEISAIPDPERRTFVMANLVAEQLTYRLFKKFVQQLSTGNLVESIQALSAIAPILVILAPYIYGFSSHAPSRSWLRGVFLDLTGRNSAGSEEYQTRLVYRHSGRRERCGHHHPKDDRCSCGRGERPDRGDIAQ